MKLDLWKLENPKYSITGKISLPLNQNSMSKLTLTDDSLKLVEKSVIGGLL
jgi:hypothetical protein